MRIEHSTLSWVFDPQTWPLASPCATHPQMLPLLQQVMMAVLGAPRTAALCELGQADQDPDTAEALLKVGVDPGLAFAVHHLLVLCMPFLAYEGAGAMRSYARDLSRVSQPCVWSTLFYAGAHRLHPPHAGHRGPAQWRGCRLCSGDHHEGGTAQNCS